MKITMKMIYDDVQFIKERINGVQLFKWMAGVSLFISVGVLMK